MKKTVGYYNLKKKIDFLLMKTSSKFKYCFTLNLKTKTSIYCYSYENASMLADYVEKKYKLKRIVNGTIPDSDHKYFKYLDFY